MTLSDSKPFDTLFKIWAIVLPINSWVLIPSNPGTTPGLLLSLASLVFTLLIAISFKRRNIIGIGPLTNNFYRDFIIFVYILTMMNGLAQLTILFKINEGYDYNFKHNVILVNELGGTFLRSSLFTQSIYLIAASIICFFTKYFYKADWNKYIFVGASLFLIYGFYEWFYYLLFGTTGDFLSNRVFALDIHGNPKLGSVNQFTDVFGFRSLRMKSLSSEPSTFALTVLPLWIFAVHIHKPLLHIPMLIALILSNSSTAFLGIVLYFIYRIVRYHLKDRYCQLLIYFFAIVAVLNYKRITTIFGFLLFDKLDSISGNERSSSMMLHLDYFAQMPFLNKLYGIGFGYVRSTDFFSTLMVNSGIIGFILFSLFFLYPVFKLQRSYFNDGLKIILLVVYASLMISVPEFSYLTTWLFLGISYSQLAKEKALKNQIQLKPVPSLLR
ncbi:hypothetical protein MKY59_19825 [Paenibacillus sp. FSL W8-0426]|uniref:hypothetical protein n=1 Tax=Paenibacillus sp. FSL W8-0426 TaxID=2921714 RepID=UPI0030D89829